MNCPIRRQTPYPLLWQSLLLPALFCLSCPGFADITRVYRCTGEHGQVEFRQGPCVDGSSQQELEIEDVKVGWEAPAATVEVKKRPGKTTAKKSSSPSGNSKKQEEKCLKTEQRLENINRKLRRGYKAGKGADLRHKRRQYEEYLDRLCS
jgi:hypothetical protein